MVNVKRKHPFPTITCRATVLYSKKTLNYALHLFHHLVWSAMEVKSRPQRLTLNCKQGSLKVPSHLFCLKSQEKSELYKYDTVKVKTLKVARVFGYIQLKCVHTRINSCLAELTVFLNKVNHFEHWISSLLAI